MFFCVTSAVFRNMRFMALWARFNLSKTHRTPMFSFELTISEHNALAPGLSCASHWAQWLQASDPQEKEQVRLQHPQETPALDFLPAMQRRRLSPLSRMVFSVAWPILARYPQCPVVFCSCNGEINRSFQLLIELAQGNGVSPTSFGLSVHNAIAGQLAIHHGNYAEQSAIAAHANGLEHAMLEAWLMLQDGASQVLVLYANDPLEARYEVNIERAPFPYACALLVEPGAGWRLSRDDAATAPLNQDNDPGVLARLISGQAHWTTLTAHPPACWTWTRQP